MPYLVRGYIAENTAELDPHSDLAILSDSTVMTIDHCQFDFWIGPFQLIFPFDGIWD